MKQTRELVVNPIDTAAEGAKNDLDRIINAGRPGWVHPTVVTIITFAMMFSDAISLEIMLSSIMNDSMALLMAVTVCCAFALDGSASLAGILLKKKADPATKDAASIPFYLMVCGVAFGIAFITSGALQIVLSTYGTGAALAVETGMTVSGAGALEAAVGSPAAIVTAVFLSLLRGATSAVCLALGYAASDPQTERLRAIAYRKINRAKAIANQTAEKEILGDNPNYETQIADASAVQKRNIDAKGEETKMEARQKMADKAGTPAAADRITKLS